MVFLQLGSSAQAAASQDLFRGQFARSIGSALVALLLSCSWLATSTRGGLASSDVVVVINGGSLNSRTLANHYAALRKIPASNMIVLEKIPNTEVISVEEFRNRILKPLLAELDRRKLGDHVQCIAYSADFPTTVDFKADAEPLGELPKGSNTQGSINALTYLYTSVVAEQPLQYTNLGVNFYARQPIDHYFISPAGEATREAWEQIQQHIAQEEHAEAADALSVMLKAHPEQFPLAYLAAAEAAQAGDAPRAIQLLELAIAKGWSAGGYLESDKRFDSLRDEPNFQVLEFMLDAAIKDQQPSVAFRSHSAWTPNGIPVADPRRGLRYILCTVLGVTRGGGTTLAGAIEALERSARADSTHPQGGFYFCLTDDVRTKTRQPGFEQAVAELREMGFEAELVKDVLPRNKPSVLGAQLGTPSFDWSTSGSQLVAGAIVENLTSHGGVMKTASGQTKLTRLIEAGAAGSSGTVSEPYALQPKFPHPRLYVHYARGASLAEAFYMSVASPYQLLIVGDPLCQPFSNAPDPQLDTRLRTLKPGESLVVEPNVEGPGFVDWLDSDQPRAQRTTPLAPAAVGVLFDNQNLKTGLVAPRVEVKIAGSSLGYHEVCFRFVADDPTAQRTDTIIPIWIGDQDLVRAEFVGSQAGADGHAFSLRDGSLELAVSGLPVNAKAVQRVALWHDFEQLAVADGSQADFTIPLSRLGMGPVRLQAQAELAGGTIVQSQPIWIEVRP